MEVSTHSSETHPIISGAYPDPSICRVGLVYYLANSSFEWFPAIPIWKSEDLVNWDLAGNALTRPSQFPPGQFGSSEGVYAPTLRFHEGKFYLITTLVTDESRHYLYTAEAGWDQRGGEGWSDPVVIEGLGGIDPDLAWDSEGNCYLTCCTSSQEKYEISQARIDLETGGLLSEPKLIWTGTGLQWPEGPHLYEVGGQWYLLSAEGGTERGHVICIARASSPGGPFQSHPNNPIFTRRSTDHKVQGVGHGDFVQMPDGSWAVVYLGVRLSGVMPGFHVNGRETFLAGIDWVEGWPVVVPNRFEIPAADHGYMEDFTARDAVGVGSPAGDAAGDNAPDLPLEDPALHPRWVSPGRPPSEVAKWDEDGLILHSAQSPNGAPSGLGFRVPDARWEFTVETSTKGSLAARLRQDEQHWYEVAVKDGVATARISIGPVSQNATVDLAGEGCALILRSVDPYPAHSQGPDTIELVMRDSSGDHLLATADGRYLSTEVAGGFIGRMLLVHAPETNGVVRAIRYTPNS